MRKSNNVHSKAVRKFSNCIGPKEWDREKWIAEVLRLASFRYNLEDKDIEKYIRSKKSK